MMEMDWSPDFCLACDRQTSGEAYCSQACRLADLETSEPVSPASGPRASWASSRLSSGSGFYLSPAIDFSAYKSSSLTSAPAASPDLSKTRTAYGSSPVRRSQSASSQTSSPKSSLTPSSSHSSLMSIQTASTQGTSLSDQARNELRGYTSSFDQVRDWKRRMTMS
ncbi:MAG: hypothetical protein FRX48_08306 [Lasallia pustulata]|uniref:Life-span regulatory factor n=1 Tax=Lasallia pustulata TaxID=136370 RepID=A0A5M8PFE6_9LECA|nr:MAG: hypothetical protein FRX48_08306 [Lasallia pustulata]